MRIAHDNECNAFQVADARRPGPVVTQRSGLVADVAERDDGRHHSARGSRSTKRLSAGHWEGGHLLILFVVGILVATSGSSLASCAPLNIGDSFHKSDAVFSAHITEIVDPRAGETSWTTADILVYEFETLHAWKGDPGYGGIFRGRRGTAAIDEVFLIFAQYRSEGLWSFGRCSGSERFSVALRQRQALGEPAVSYASLPEPITLEFLWAAMENGGTQAKVAARMLADLELQEMMVKWASTHEWDLTPGPSLNQLINILGLAGPAALPFVRELDPELSTSQSYDVRSGWMFLLGELGEGNELAAWIRRGMSDPNDWVRDAASRATGRLSGEAAQTLIQFLESQLTASDLVERQYVALALSFMNELNPWTIDALCESDDERNQQRGGFGTNCISTVSRNRDAALQSTTGKQIVADLGL